jgi:hypothetical protein
VGIKDRTKKLESRKRRMKKNGIAFKRLLIERVNKLKEKRESDHP